MKDNPGITDNQRQTAFNLGCSLALVSIFGIGLIGNFIMKGLHWGWVAILSVIALAGIGALSAALQKMFESGGGGGGGGGGQSAPDPSPEPSRKLEIPKAPESPKTSGIPTHWPPDRGL